MIKKWGRQDGTLKSIVDLIIRIKRTMEEERALKNKLEYDMKETRNKLTREKQQQKSAKKVEKKSRKK